MISVKCATCIRLQEPAHQSSAKLALLVSNNALNSRHPYLLRPNVCIRSTDCSEVLCPSENILSARGASNMYSVYVLYHGTYRTVGSVFDYYNTASHQYRDVTFTRIQELVSDHSTFFVTNSKMGDGSAQPKRVFFGAWLGAMSAERLSFLVPGFLYTCCYIRSLH